MQFQFWTFLPCGKRIEVGNNLFQATARAAAVGGRGCFGRNPATQRTFRLA